MGKIIMFPTQTNNDALECVVDSLSGIAVTDRDKTLAAKIIIELARAGLLELAVTEAGYALLGRINAYLQENL